MAADRSLYRFKPETPRSAVDSQQMLVIAGPLLAEIAQSFDPIII